MIADATNAAEKVVGSPCGSYLTPMDWAVALLQEPYTKLAWGLLERSRKQQEAFQALLNASLEVYVDLLYSTVPSPRKEPQPVKEVIGRLDGFSADEIERLETYEKNNKNRVSLMKWFDRGPV